MAFAWPVVADLGKYLGRTLTANTSAQQALDIAVGLVQNETEQTIAPVTADVVTLSPHGPGPAAPTAPCQRVLHLPQRPVTAVTSVVVSGVTLASTLYQWDTDGDLTHLGGDWGYVPRSVVVTYDHGLSALPADLKGVVLQMAARILDNPQGKIKQQQDGYSHELPAVFPLEFSRTETRILSNYKIPVSA